MSPRIPQPSAALPGGDWSADPATPLGSGSRTATASPASPTTRGRRSSSSSSSTSREKGKGRAGAAPGSPIRPPSANTSLSSLLDEALHSPLDLPSSPPKAATEPAPPPLLARPPLAHHPSGYVGPGLRPRLMTKLSHTGSPTASLSYTTADEFKARERERYVSSPDADKSKQWEWRPPPPTGPAHFHKHMLMERHGSVSAFPELDPATGLPLSQDVIPEEPRERQLQRTISEQWRRGSMDQASAAKPRFGSLASIPTIPSLPSFQDLRTSMDDQRRTFTTSTSALASRMFSTSKSRIDSMLSEEDQAATKEEENLKHQIKYKTPKNPIILCHGLLGFDFLGPANLPALQISHWRGIREVLEKSGCEVLICRVPATGSIMERAEVLHQTIGEKFPGRTVNLIAHSMGGLDCRYLCSQIAPTKFDICSLTTISTPHRGSPFADYVIDNVIGRERLQQLLSVMTAMDLPNSGDGAAFTALGTRAMKEFNTEVIDREDIKYYSWGARYEPGLFDTFRWPWSVIYEKEGPNDGMVSVSSAQWGEYRGTLLDVNHLDLVGWVNQMRYMMSSLTGKPISFKPATFYLEMSDYLAQQGF